MRHLLAQWRTALTLNGNPDFTFEVSIGSGYNDHSRVTAYDGDEKAGYISWIENPERWQGNSELKTNGMRVAVITGVAVNPNYRGGGEYILGTRLFEEAKGEVSTRGLTLVHDSYFTRSGFAWYSTLPGIQYGVISVVGEDGVRTHYEVKQLA